MLDPEQFVDDARDYLRANLPAYITAKNATKTDFDLAAPKYEAYYFGGPPALTVWRPVDRDRDAGHVAVQPVAPAALVDAQPRMMIRAFLQEVEFEKLTRMAYRYAECIMQTMIQPGAFGGHEKVDRVTCSWGVNPETNEREEFTGGCLVVFTIGSMAVR